MCLSHSFSLSIYPPPHSWFSLTFPLSIDPNWYPIAYRLSITLRNHTRNHLHFTLSAITIIALGWQSLLWRCSNWIDKLNVPVQFICPWSKGPFKEPSTFLSICRWGSDLPPSLSSLPLSLSLSPPPSLSLSLSLYFSLSVSVSPSLPLSHFLQLSLCFSPVIFLFISCVDLSLLLTHLSLIKFRDKVRKLSLSAIAVCAGGGCRVYHTSTF